MIPALLRLRQEDGKVKAQMNYIIRHSFLPPPKKQTKGKKRRGRGRKGEREEQREVEGRVGGGLDSL